MVILPLIATAFIGQLGTTPPFHVGGGDELVEFNSYFVDNSTKLNDNELDSFSIGGDINNQITLTQDYSSYVLDFAFSVDNSTQDFYVNGIQYVGFRPYTSTFNAYDNLNADFSIRLSTEEGASSIDYTFNMYIYPTYNAHPAEGYACMQQLGIKCNSSYYYQSYMTKDADTATKYIARLGFSKRQDFKTLNFSDSSRYLFVDFSPSGNIGGYNIDDDYVSFNHVFQFYSTYTKNVGTYQDGYNVGFNLGYNNGLNEGISKSLEDVNPLLIAFNSISKVLDIELFPGFKLGYGVGFGFACGIVLMILKFFH